MAYTNERQNMMASIKAITQKLSSEIIKPHTDNNTSVVRSTTEDRYVVVETMRSKVDEILSRHDMVFESIARSLCDCKGNDYSEMFSKVADRIFSTDSEINWGRIITLYAFGRALVSACDDGDVDDDKIFVTRNLIDDYVGVHLSEWIHSRGGWSDMVRMFKEESIENEMWTYAIRSLAVGLGSSLMICWLSGR